MTRSNRVSSSTRFFLKASFKTRNIRLLNCRGDGLLLTISVYEETKQKEQSVPSPSHHTFVHTLFTGIHYDT